MATTALPLHTEEEEEEGVESLGFESLCLTLWWQSMCIRVCLSVCVCVEDTDADAGGSFLGKFSVFLFIFFCDLI